MSTITIADIFRDWGPAWRAEHQGHISLWQLKVMSAIEHCRCADLGGHLWCCPQCGHMHVAYNSCRNRHCPTCQATASQRWLADRQAELLPVEYYHVVFTLPAAIADIAYQNKAVIYNLLCRTAGLTLLTIARDPKRLGARIGVTVVLHTWGSAMTHHPHVHCVIPGGGLALGNDDWVPCKKGFFLPVLVLSRLFRRLFPGALDDAYRDGLLAFHGRLAPLREPTAFHSWLYPCRGQDWVVYAKRPFAGADDYYRRDPSLHGTARSTFARGEHRMTAIKKRKIECSLAQGFLASTQQLWSIPQKTATASRKASGVGILTTAIQGRLDIKRPATHPVIERLEPTKSWRLYKKPIVGSILQDWLSAPAISCMSLYQPTAR